MVNPCRGQSQEPVAHPYIKVELGEQAIARALKPAKMISLWLDSLLMVRAVQVDSPIRLTLG